MVGQKFGLWTVLSDAGLVNKKRAWWCRCACGEILPIIGTDLKNGKTKGCRTCAAAAREANRRRPTGPRAQATAVARVIDPTLTVAQLIDRFIEASQFSTSTNTGTWYGVYAKTLREYAGAMLVKDLTPATIEQWIELYYGHQGNTSKNSAGRTARRIINWGLKTARCIAENYLEGLRVVAADSREYYVTKSDYAKILKAIHERQRVSGKSKRAMLDVVRFLYHTGCRPQEFRMIEASWVSGNKITFPVAKSKGKKKHRIIFLNSQAKQIVDRLVLQYPTGGPIFRNTLGTPWTRAAVVEMFKQLRRRVGLPQLIAYSFRHAFITRKLEEGVDVATVAALAGNSPGIIWKCYSHVCQNESRLLAAVE